MFKTCVICGKGPLNGRSVVRKGLVKSKGGTGSKIVRSAKRLFLPNLQKIRIMIKGKATTSFVCTKCIKKGEIRKA